MVLQWSERLGKRIKKGRKQDRKAKSTSRERERERCLREVLICHFWQWTGIVTDNFTFASLSLRVSLTFHFFKFFLLLADERGKQRLTCKLHQQKIRLSWGENRRRERRKELESPPSSFRNFFSQLLSFLFIFFPYLVSLFFSSFQSKLHTGFIKSSMHVITRDKVSQRFGTNSRPSFKLSWNVSQILLFVVRRQEEMLTFIFPSNLNNDWLCLSPSNFKYVVRDMVPIFPFLSLSFLSLSLLPFRQHRRHTHHTAHGMKRKRY